MYDNYSLVKLLFRQSMAVFFILIKEGNNIGENDKNSIMKNNLICIKNLKKEGFSVVADENTRDMFYVEHMYPVGSPIPNEETLKEMDDAVYELYLKEENYD